MSIHAEQNERKRRILFIEAILLWSPPLFKQEPTVWLSWQTDCRSIQAVSPLENGVYASNINLMTRRSVTEGWRRRVQLYKIDWLSRFCRRLDENKQAKGLSNSGTVASRALRETSIEAFVPRCCANEKGLFTGSFSQAGEG